ncbi:MAG: ABC transporter permease [Chitinophagales bacterium]|jgi:lipoprotein-releasing system permease protein|nr:ABC transporter permease [Chitinophagales bacterium]
MNINYQIANTYLWSNKKMTAVAVFGVVLGIGIYIFMNSLLVGFDKSSNDSMFKNIAHIRVFRDDEIARPLISSTSDATPILINPKVVPNSNTIINPKRIMQEILKIEEVTHVMPQVNVNAFYLNGKSQINGLVVGVEPEAANQMYQIEKTIVKGDFKSLKSNPNGIVIGIGIADKMNLKIGDMLSLTSSKGQTESLKVMAIFQSNNAQIDKYKSYVNISKAQSLLAEGPNYITEINVNTIDPELAPKLAPQIAQITQYTAEDWKAANETLMAAFKMRKIVITFVSLTIVLVAAFGIYNILNMTVTSKINDIAILKAIGFKGKDVIRIFTAQALAIGGIGVLGGMVMATLVITLLRNVYIGGDIGYFPVDYEPTKYLQGATLGMVITFLAGYIPAKKAANVDPVSIFRK